MMTGEAGKITFGSLVTSKTSTSTCGRRGGRELSRGPTRGCRSSSGWGGRVRSSRASGGTRAANLRFGNLLDFRQHQRGFVLQSHFHRLVIALGIFSRPVFEFQVAQIVVD